MLSAIDQEVMIARAIHLGATEYLTKPVGSRELVDTVERTLGKLGAAI